MSKDNYKLRRLGVLAPAALSACMDASVLAVPTAGAIVSTVLKELSKAFMLKKWFHGNLTAREAEHLMMEKGKNGSFLVRESRGHPGDYVLSVRVRGRVSHVIIKKQQEKYDVGTGEQFDDLVGLIEHCRTYPMVESSGDVLRLLQPISTSLKITNKEQSNLGEVSESDYTSEDSGKSGFENEFYLLKPGDNTKQYTYIEAEKLENINKNRYKNILPYDQTRVILLKNDDGSGADYINANYIFPFKQCELLSPDQSSNESLNSVQSMKITNTYKVHSLGAKSLSDDALKDMKRRMKMDKMNGNDCHGNRSYIATQGCLTNTKCDFWRMICQEDVRIIVMITKEFENGKKKCEKYWPDHEVVDKCNGLDIKLKTETYLEDYVIREIEITGASIFKIVYQYQFIAWPDHGTPKKPTSVLAFLYDINKRMNIIMQNNDKPKKKTLCVHCSAGVGRTGTYIVLDMLINKINTYGPNCKLDVCETVRLIRNQRNGMVQNISQYKFIHQAIQEYLTSYINKSNGKVMT